MVSKEAGNGTRPLMESLGEMQRRLAQVASDTLPEDFLACALELTGEAPSESYFRPWRWIIVRSEPGKQQLESAAYSEVPLSRSPIVLICLADTAAWKTTQKQLQEMVAAKILSAESARNVLNRIHRHYSASPQSAERAALANAFLAVHQVLTAAACCQVPARWVSVFDEKKIQTYFHIPDQFLVAALVAIGHEDKDTPATFKLPAQLFVYHEKFGEVTLAR
ncbi:MAG: nitroreductase family protein [Acidobacteriia bacterium]|nr:nitroreductase family protein [Terriglobia bacterium]